MSQAPYHGNQYPTYSQQQPPQMQHAYTADSSYYTQQRPQQHPQGSGYPGAAGPAHMSTYSSVPQGMAEHNRPPAAYGGEYRPSRMSTYNQRPAPPNMRYQRSEARYNSQYGHLVTERTDRRTACSGASCSACCRYNMVGCCVCCNGYLRLCGMGKSIRELFNLQGH